MPLFLLMGRQAQESLIRSKATKKKEFFSFVYRTFLKERKRKTLKMALALQSELHILKFTIKN